MLYQVYNFEAFQSKDKLVIFFVVLEGWVYFLNFHYGLVYLSGSYQILDLIPFFDHGFIDVGD
jgi:hypothetical protein